FFVLGNFRRKNVGKLLGKIKPNREKTKIIGDLVGAVRFELTTSWTRTTRASQATLRPDLTGRELALRFRVWQSRFWCFRKISERTLKRCLSNSHQNCTGPECSWC